MSDYNNQMIVNLLKSIKMNKEAMNDIKRDLSWQYGRLMELTSAPIDNLDMRDAEQDYDDGMYPHIDQIIEYYEVEQ